VFLLQSSEGFPQASLMFMHYLENGQIMLCLIYNRETFFVPLIYVMKALVNENDKWIYNVSV
jgi:DNA-directed RNA polymerase I subunit RPA2